MESCKKKMGRPTHYANNEEGLEQLKKDTQLYVFSLFDTGKRFSISGWAAFLGISRPTLYAYCQRSQLWYDSLRQLATLIDKKTRFMPKGVTNEDE